MNSAFGSGHRGDVLGVAASDADLSDDVLDTVFGVLASERRHVTLRCIVAADGTTPLADVVTHVTAHENQSDRTRVAIDLHHTQFPKLVDHGLVKYDPETKRVSPTPAGREAVSLVDTQHTTHHVDN